MKKAVALVFALVMAATILLTGCGQQNGQNKDSSAGSTSGSDTKDQITIRYGSADAPDLGFVKGIYAFKDYVEEASNGSIKVDTYINGVLGGDRELCEAMQIETCDMAVVMGGILANYNPQFNIFQVPFLFDNKQACYDAMDGAFGEKMSELVDQLNFKCLGWADGNTYHIAYSGKPITTISGLSGMKIRVPEIQMDIDFFSALGATPTPVSFSETYTALEQKVVDGLEMPIEQMYCSKFMEAVDCITYTGHLEGAFPILMSTACWNKLSDEQKQIVTDGVKKQIEVNRESAKTAEETYIQEFVDKGGTVVELDAGELDKMKSIGEEITAKYVDQIGQDLIDLARSFD